MTVASRQPHVAGEAGSALFGGRGARLRRPGLGDKGAGIVGLQMRRGPFHAGQRLFEYHLPVPDDFKGKHAQIATGQKQPVPAIGLSPTTY